MREALTQMESYCRNGPSMNMKVIRRLGTEKVMGSWRNHIVRNLADYLYH